jgi:DinB family protein
MMNANDVLIDLLEDNRRRLHRLFVIISDEGLYWKPEAGANNVAVTVWHMARILDVYLTQHVKGWASEAEGWFRQGWANKTQYDPRGHGRSGWGTLTGYTQEEVATIPQFTKEQLLGYLDEVYDTVKEYLASTPIEKLLTPSIGFHGRYTQYQCIQMALLDNIRHLGEVFAIHARQDRQNQEAIWN